MQIGRIAGATHNLGAPPDWDRDRHGVCGHLPVRVEMLDNGIISMTSAWEPTPDEIERLAAGAPIYLSVLGCTHPPVSLSVGDSPKVEDV